jgi:nucleotide-binding universal stress UspA family protein
MTVAHFPLPGRIGIGIDPHAPADAALRFGAFLAGAYGAELVLVAAGDPSGAHEVAVEAAASRLSGLAAGLTPGGVPRGRSGYRYLHPFGVEWPPSRASHGTGPERASVPETLRQAVRRNDLDLLVLPRGVRWAERLYLMESVAERVAAHSHTPVLAVPDSGREPRVGPRPTVVVVERPGGFSPEARMWARSLAERLSARVTVAVAGLEGAGSLETVRTLARRTRADLIVMESLPREARGRRSLPHVAAGLLRTAACPVLLLPIQAPRERPVRLAKRAARRTATLWGIEAAGSSPTVPRWHIRTSTIQRLPTDSRAART